MKLQTLKGFRDFLPAQAIARKWLREQIEAVFTRWGYDPLETPTLEPLELFAGNIGEDEKLFFKFKDPGGRDVALRYDQTIPTCRVLAHYAPTLPFPFKRYQIQSAFRAENPQRGRYREFLQCDADIFGIASPYADAEVIALSLDIYKTLGFPKATVLVNDRALLKTLPYKAIVAIDKLKKIGEEGVLAEMVKSGIAAAEAKTLLTSVLSLKPNETIATIFSYLESLGIDPSWYAFDPTIARSFSYSSGPIWEVVIPGFSGGSVLGGERYDHLIGNIGGNSIPATGFAVGFDRTLEALEQCGLLPKKPTLTNVLVTIFSPELAIHSSAIAAAFREKHIATELFPDPNVKLEKQLKYADRKGIPFVCILGPNEVAKHTVTVKSLGTKTQREHLSLDAAVSYVLQYQNV